MAKEKFVVEKNSDASYQIFFGAQRTQNSKKTKKCQKKIQKKIKKRF